MVFDVNYKIRTEQIRFFAESLKSDKLKGYVPQFVSETEVRPLGLQTHWGLASAQEIAALQRDGF